MISLIRTTRCSLLHGLLISFTLDVVASLSMMYIHRSEIQRSFSQPPLNEQNQLNTICNTFDCSENFSGITRRQGCNLILRSTFAGIFPWHLSQQIAYADDDLTILHPEREAIILSGIINLPSGTTDHAGLANDKIDATKKNSKPALYVTARPNRPDNVPEAILDGSRGKSPPVLAARFEDPTFPFQFQLSERDLTLEGARNNEHLSNSDRFWWANDDLIVSARWDSDGVASTRSPEDLVGRSMWKKCTAATKKNQANIEFLIDLKGRGSFGRFATKGN